MKMGPGWKEPHPLLDLTFPSRTTANGATTAEVFSCFSLLCQKRQLGHIGRTFSNRTPGEQSYAGRGWLTEVLGPFHFYEIKEDHPSHYSIIQRVLSEETRILLYRLQIRDHELHSSFKTGFLTFLQRFLDHSQAAHLEYDLHHWRELSLCRITTYTVCH